MANFSYETVGDFGVPGVDIEQTLLSSYDPYSGIDLRGSRDRTIYNSEEYYSSDFDGRPALGLFTTVDNNISQDNFTENIPDLLFTQISKISMVSNGDGRIIERGKDNWYGGRLSHIGESDNSEFNTNFNEYFKPSGGWNYIALDGIGYHYSNNGGTEYDGSTNQKYWIQDDEYETVLGINYGYGYAGYYPYLYAYSATNNGMVQEPDSMVTSAENYNYLANPGIDNYDWAKWIKSTECLSYGKCLNFRATNLWENTSDPGWGNRVSDSNSGTSTTTWTAWARVEDENLSSGVTCPDSSLYDIYGPASSQISSDDAESKAKDLINDANLETGCIAESPPTLNNPQQTPYFGTACVFSGCTLLNGVEFYISDEPHVLSEGEDCVSLLETIFEDGNYPIGASCSNIVEQQYSYATTSNTTTISTGDSLATGDWNDWLGTSIVEHRSTLNGVGQANECNAVMGLGTEYKHYWITEATAMSLAKAVCEDKYDEFIPEGYETGYSAGTIRAKCKCGDATAPLTDADQNRNKIRPNANIFELTNNHEYRTLNQYQQIYNSNQDTYLNPHSSLKISFYMKTITVGQYNISPDEGGDFTQNPPYVEVGISKGRPSPLKTIGEFYKAPTYGHHHSTENTPHWSTSRLDQQGIYNSIVSHDDWKWSYFGAMNRFKNKTRDTWEKKEFTFNLSGHHAFDTVEEIRSLYFMVQSSANTSNGTFRGNVLLDNFEVKESYDFIPDCDVRKKKGPNEYGKGELTKYYDPTIENQLEAYNDTTAPLEAQFYFYPRYNYNNLLDTKASIIYNDFREGMFYLYDIDWGDGTPNEFTAKPELLEENISVYHTYEMAGIFEVTGTILRMKPDKDYNPIGIIHNERFVLRININEGADEDFTYFGSEGFSFIPYKDTLPCIGGYSKESIYYKSLKRQLGIISENISTDISFTSQGDKLKTEIALNKLDQSYSQGLYLLNEFKRKRYTVGGNIPLTGKYGWFYQTAIIKYSGNQYTTGSYLAKLLLFFAKITLQGVSNHNNGTTSSSIGGENFWRDEFGNRNYIVISPESPQPGGYGPYQGYYQHPVTLERFHPSVFGWRRSYPNSSKWVNESEDNTQSVWHNILNNIGSDKIGTPSTAAEAPYPYDDIFEKLINLLDPEGAFAFPEIDMGESNIINNGLQTFTEEIGKSIGNTDVTNIRYFNKPKSMWEMLGFEDPESADFEYAYGFNLNTGLINYSSLPLENFIDNGDNSYDGYCPGSVTDEVYGTPDYCGFQGVDVFIVTVGEQYLVEFDFETISGDGLDTQFNLGTGAVGSSFSTDGSSNSPHVIEGYNSVILTIIYQNNMSSNDYIDGRLSFQINQTAEFKISNVSVRKQITNVDGSVEYETIEEALQASLLIHPGNPESPRYWKNIIPKDYNIFNRQNLFTEKGFVNTYSQQDWLEDENGNIPYYPVLPKYGADGKFIEGDYPNNKTPFLLEGPITDDNLVDESLIMSINTNSQESNVFDDNSGNNNYGFSYSDFKPIFNKKTLKPEKTRNVALTKVSKNNGAF